MADGALESEACPQKAYPNLCTVRRYVGVRAESPRAARISAMRFERLASATNVSGHSRCCRTVFESTFGRSLASAASSSKALGDMWIARPSRVSCRVSPSSVNGPKQVFRTAPPSWNGSSGAGGILSARQSLRDRVRGHPVMRPDVLERLGRRDARIDDPEVIERSRRCPAKLPGSVGREAADAGFRPFRSARPRASAHAYSGRRGRREIASSSGKPLIT